MRCWWCGVEPERVDTYDLAVLESVEPLRRIQQVRWPEGDHTHAERPPTAEQMAGQAHRMLNERVY